MEGVDINAFQITQEQKNHVRRSHGWFNNILGHNLSRNWYRYTDMNHTNIFS
jgi:hypothetical protein